MIAGTATRPRNKDRILAKQSKACIANWQASAPHMLVVSLTAGSLAVHRWPAGTCAYRLDWSGEEVLVIDTVAGKEPYRFQDVTSALAFLDGLVLHAIACWHEARRVNFAASARRMAWRR